MLAFLFPAFLWLFLLLVPIWALALAVPRRLSAWRFWGSLTLRTIGLCALVLALAGIQIVQPVRETQVVFLLDSSDSVTLSQRAQAETYLQQALAELPPVDRAGIVVFGEQAEVERLPNDQQLLGQITTFPPGTNTNIQEAIHLGLALLPAETQRRLVLLSDGGENSGDAQAAAQIAASQGIPIDVVTLDDSPDGLDAQISGLELPASVGEGQRLRLAINVDSRGPAEALPTSARLLVEYRPAEGPQTLADQEVQLDGGPQRFTVTLPPPPPEATFHRYVVRLVAEGDARPENNIAEAFTLVRSRPRVLLVEGTPQAARNLQQTLDAADLEIELVPPERVPSGLGGLIAYDAVVLVDVPERSLDERTQNNLRAYVQDLGRGLAMIGGPHSFGAGGWRDTPVEEALPVAMDIRSEVRQPPVSIVVIIDVSGSMSIEENGISKVQLAAEGAIRIAENIRDEDELTVIPFDSAPQGIVGPIAGVQRDEAIERIRGISADGGGITIFSALQEAASIIRSSDKPVRHIITITDGSDTVEQEGAPELVADLRAEGVTLSSIAVGAGTDVPFLRDIVQHGDGRFFLTSRAGEIPNILVNETQATIQPLVIEGEFAPVRHGSHALLRGIESMPPLYGYIATSPKDSTRVLLSSERGDPLLAVWRYGLGHSLAWTPDMRGQWARDFVRWPDYQQVASRMMSWLLPDPDTQRMTLETRVIDNQLTLAARVRTETGAPATGLRVVGRMIASDGSSFDIALREVAPGSYRLALQEAQAGVYMVQLMATDEQGEPQASVTGGAAVPFSREYRTGGANPALLAALADLTGGRMDPPPAAVYTDTGQQAGLVREPGLLLVWLALLLLPLDVAIRRLFGAQRTFAQPRRKQAAPPQTARPPRAAQPAAAPAATQPAAPADPLERMRAAQEAARKRARGEDE
jgi:uncharacterized membrane protein